MYKDKDNKTKKFVEEMKIVQAQNHKNEQSWLYPVLQHAQKLKRDKYKKEFNRKKTCISQ